MIPMIVIPEDAKCQEASQFSVSMYLPCSAPATTIVYHERDGRGYYMCDMCASHNVSNRGGKLVAWVPTSVMNPVKPEKVEPKRKRRK